MSAFIQLAHVGFHKCIGKIAHGLLRIHSPYIAELCGTLDFISYASTPTTLPTTVINRGCGSSTPTGIPALPAPAPSTFFPRVSKSDEGRESGQQSARGVTITYSNNAEISVGVLSIRFDAQLAVLVATAFQAHFLINHWQRLALGASFESLNMA